MSSSRLCYRASCRRRCCRDSESSQPLFSDSRSREPTTIVLVDRFVIWNGREPSPRLASSARPAARVHARLPAPFRSVRFGRFKCRARSANRPVVSPFSARPFKGNHLTPIRLCAFYESIAPPHFSSSSSSSVTTQDDSWEFKVTRATDFLGTVARTNNNAERNRGHRRSVANLRSALASADDARVCLISPSAAGRSYRESRSLCDRPGSTILALRRANWKNLDRVSER